MVGPDREIVRKTPRYSNMKAMSDFGSSRSCRAACVLAAFSVFSAAPAQDYPSRPVRVVVPSAPGGGFDLVGRVLAQKLGEQTGQAFVVENRPGAGTLLGTPLAPLPTATASWSEGFRTSRSTWACTRSPATIRWWISLPSGSWSATPTRWSRAR